MKQNGLCMVDNCSECPEIEIEYGKGYRCKILNITKEYTGDLFKFCRLPELKEIKVWFEKRPPEAKIFDFCVYRTDNKTWPWELEQRMHITEYADYDWSSRWTSETKEFIESLIGCKIPE